MRELGSIDDPAHAVGEGLRGRAGRERAGEKDTGKWAHSILRVYMDRALEINRHAWDALAAVHRRDATGFYGVESLLAGADILSPIEAAEIGDVRGLRVAHLQCHLGLDSICLARRGASVVGIDFSPAAIREARQLAELARVAVRFVEANVYDAREHVDGDFDLVYTTWGTIVWLPDIPRWAHVIASLLRPGGRLYFADAHPALLCCDMIDGRLVVTANWRTAAEQPLVETGDRSYTGDVVPSRETWQWVHPTGAILNALIDAGLRIEWVREHAALPWAHCALMRVGDDRLFRLPADAPQLPLALTILAQRSA